MIEWSRAIDQPTMADTVAEDSGFVQPSSMPAPSIIAETPSLSLSPPRSPASPRCPEKSSQHDKPEDFPPVNGCDAVANGRAAEDHRSPAVPIEYQKGHEDNEARGEEDASEAAFRAEAAAFARKDKRHELAVKRLVDDLIGNESEAPRGEPEENGGEGKSAAAGNPSMAVAAEMSSIEATDVASMEDLVEVESVALRGSKVHGEGDEQGLTGEKETVASENAGTEDAAEVGLSKMSAASSSRGLAEKESEIDAEANVDGSRDEEGRRGEREPGSGIPTMETSPNKVSAGSPVAKKRSSLIKSKQKDGKQQEKKCQTSPQDAKTKRSPSALAVKPDHSSPSDGRRRVHPLKEKEKVKERTSPGSPSRGSPLSPRGISGSPSSKTSPRSPLRPLGLTSSAEKTANAVASSRKVASRRQEPGKPSPKSSAPDMNLESKDTQQSQADSDNVHQRVKQFFHKRKSSIGFGSKKAVGLVGGVDESVISSEHTGLLARDNPDLGPFLLRLARQAAGESSQKALDFATRAAKSYEVAANGKPSLDLVMSLHVLAAVHCTLGQFEEAIPVLEQSINATDIEGGQEHALAAFAGNMQLGDTLALQGRGEDALAAYHTGLEVQMRALGEKDPRVGETCSYVAEAHAQAMQFEKAEELCQRSLDIHAKHSAPASTEEATDRRLMGLILSGKGEHESALEHLVLASMALIANGRDAEVAAVDMSIGDAYVCLGRFDEAVFAYQKALTVFKASKGENHVAVASVYVSLAELYLKIGKLRESRTYCESALKIYGKQSGQQLDEVASGLTEIAAVYEALNEKEQAISLLQKASVILETIPGQQSATAGVEAQIGVLNNMQGKYTEARASFSKAVLKLRATSEEKSTLLGIVLNQMGLSCLHLSEIEIAVEIFEEAKNILEVACGPHHPDTLAVYSNMAGAYDALGRLDNAINALQYVVEVREEELGTANPDFEDEKCRLAELLKEAGRLRARRLNNTLELLMQSNSKPTKKSVAGQTPAEATVPGNGHRISDVKVEATA